MKSSSPPMRPERRVCGESLLKKLTDADYPVRETTVMHRPKDVVEIVAVLVGSAVQPEEFEALIGNIKRLPGVVHAAWEASTRWTETSGASLKAPIAIE